MTIALKITLIEDWNNNLPCVVVKRKALRGADTIAAILTPAQPEAHVTITSQNDLYLEPGNSDTLAKLN